MIDLVQWCNEKPQSMVSHHLCIYFQLLTFSVPYPTGQYVHCNSLFYFLEPISLTHHLQSNNARWKGSMLIL